MACVITFRIIFPSEPHVGELIVMHVGIKIDLASFVCPWGQFHYVVMPFGVKNGPAVFQEVVNHYRKHILMTYRYRAILGGITASILNMFC